MDVPERTEEGVLGDVVNDRGWEIHRFGSGASTVLHVPHASTVIPADVRERIVLDGEQLAAELAAMTDWHTDTLAMAAAEAATSPSLVFRNRLSRLVVDPERFPDDRETMASIGMGAVYQATSTRARLRHPDPDDDDRLLQRYFHPYGEAFADLVDEVLTQTGRCVILDLHSYPLRPLPYEFDHSALRPGVCIGTDREHTPTWLRNLVAEAFAGFPGGLAENTPFAGAYVPLRHYGRDTRVWSIMIELRRDTHLNGSNELDAPRAPGIVGRLARLLNDVAGTAKN